MLIPILGFFCTHAQRPLACPKKILDAPLPTVTVSLFGDIVGVFPSYCVCPLVL